MITRHSTAPFTESRGQPNIKRDLPNSQTVGKPSAQKAQTGRIAEFATPKSLWRKIIHYIARRIELIKRRKKLWAESTTIAAHELGHALLCAINGYRIDEVSTIPEGDTLGRVLHTYTQYTDFHSYTLPRRLKELRNFWGSHLREIGMKLAGDKSQAFAMHNCVPEKKSHKIRTRLEESTAHEACTDFTESVEIAEAINAKRQEINHYIKKYHPSLPFYNLLNIDEVLADGYKAVEKILTNLIPGDRAGSRDLLQEMALELSARQKMDGQQFTEFLHTYLGKDYNWSRLRKVLDEFVVKTLGKL